MLDWNDREAIKEFIKQNNIKDIIQLNDFIKKMMGAIIEEMLEVERDEYLGYQKYQRSETTNSRNGYSSKNVRSTQGDIKLDIPRDRDGQFKPEFIETEMVNSNRSSLRNIKTIYLK